MDANNKEYIPIRVSTLRGDQKILFDAYVRVAGKHILYCRQGDSFDGVRLSRLREKKLKQLFIVSSAEKSYQTYLQINIDSAYSSKSPKPIEDRALIAQGLQQATAEEVIEVPSNSVAYNELKSGSRKYIQLILNENSALKNILLMENATESVAQHGVNVASLATALAAHVGIKDEATLQLLATGCALHDVEHHYSGLAINRPIATMSKAELEIYQNHPVAGTDRIREFDFYDPIVAKIMRSHHELIDASGFPDKLRESQIDPLVVIAAVCDAYDRLINYEKVNPKDAIKQLMIDRVGLYPLKMIQNLATVLKQRGVT